MSEVYDAGIPACPSCGRADEVAAVPAVYLAGQERVRVKVTDDDGSSHMETRIRPTALAKGLAPAPTEVPGSGAAVGVTMLGVVLVLGGITAFAVAAGAGHWRDTSSPASAVSTAEPIPGTSCGYLNGMWTCITDHTGVLIPPSMPATADAAPPPGHPSYAWLAVIGALAFLTGITLVVAAVLRGRRAARRLREGRARAELIWERGWYCPRCGTVHFRPAPDVPSGAVRLSAFRQLVWNAGGYGHMVAKYPPG